MLHQTYSLFNISFHNFYSNHFLVLMTFWNFKMSLLYQSKCVRKQFSYLLQCCSVPLLTYSFSTVFIWTSISTRTLHVEDRNYVEKYVYEYYRLEVAKHSMFSYFIIFWNVMIERLFEFSLVNETRSSFGVVLIEHGGRDRVFFHREAIERM